jgi:hypothetical protein
MRIKNLGLSDLTNLANALGFVSPPIPGAPATASFKLHWKGNVGPTSATDTGVNNFTYSGIFTHATLEWSASVPSRNFAFHSDPPGTSHETFAQLVRERNGSMVSNTEGDD